MLNNKKLFSQILYITPFLLRMIRKFPKMLKLLVYSLTLSRRISIKPFIILNYKLKMYRWTRPSLTCVILLLNSPMPNKNIIKSSQKVRLNYLTPAESSSMRSSTPQIWWTGWVSSCSDKANKFNNKPRTLENLESWSTRTEATKSKSPKLLLMLMIHMLMMTSQTCSL